MDGAALPPDRLSQYEAFAEKIVYGDLVVLAALCPLIQACHDEAHRRGDPELAMSLIQEASEVVYDLRYVLTRGPAQPGQEGSLWRHDPTFPKEGAWAPAQDAVEAAAAAYLQRPWMSCGYLEWAMIDALVRRETLAYQGEVTKAYPLPWSLAWAVQQAFTAWLPWTVEAVVAAGSAWWLYSEFTLPEARAPYRWSWAVPIGAFYGWRVLRLPMQQVDAFRFRSFKRKEARAAAHRIQAMHRCYHALNGLALDPVYIREVMKAAQDLNVMWSNAVWPLLASAIARDPRLWLTGYH